jgi:dCMP deaminase
MRISREQMLLDVCKLVAKRSTCNRLQVGAILAIDGRIISSGYNGNPSGLPHCNCTPESPCTSTIHAEANAIVHAAKYGIPTNGATLYCTDSTCLECAKLIINAGIIKVIYEKEYRKKEGIELLRSVGIDIQQGLREV